MTSHLWSPWQGFWVLSIRQYFSGNRSTRNHLSHPSTATHVAQTRSQHHKIIQGARGFRRSLSSLLPEYLLNAFSLILPKLTLSRKNGELSGPDGGTAGTPKFCTLCCCVRFLSLLFEWWRKLSFRLWMISVSYSKSPHEMVQEVWVRDGTGQVSEKVNLEFWAYDLLS